MNHPNSPQKPEEKDVNQENEDNNGGETFGNEPPVKDPKKPRDPEKYEMNSR